MSVTLPYTITNGTPHDGAQVQANFAALRDGHNAHVHNGTDTPKVNFADVDGKPASYPPLAHKASHATGGTDAIAPADIGAAPSAHKTQHATGGADALTAADIGAAPSAHKAQHATGGADALTAGDIAAAPSSHVGAGGTEHANATPTVAGFMSGSDKGKLDTVSTGAKSVAALRGTISHGGTIPLPSGFTQDQCWWIVSLYGATIPGTYGVFGTRCWTDANRVVTAQAADGGTWFNCTANYLIIGVK